MSAKASEELLKAHAVISRSWLLSQLQQKGKNINTNPGFTESETERIKWYDREDHVNFDVCADDHCQRYQGVTRASTEQVRKAIKATRGQVLCSGEEICDARFSKCCGGIMEEFQNCWEDKPKPYLLGIADRDHFSSNGQTSNEVQVTQKASTDMSMCKLNPTKSGDNDFPDLRIEENAKNWILGSPASFCNTKDKKILEQVLNNYDQETTDFFRWKVTYDSEELNLLVQQKSGIDFGEILDLIPLERGISGRIIKLKIVGNKKTLTIGKELEIRKTLSPTHLYSSAFTVEKNHECFILYGAGWGHGVGLCQIGAAMMGEKGYRYQDILSHYYPDTELNTLYV
jgi:SpoIID/LytB domain protein